jgi:hypothetical protein
MKQNLPDASVMLMNRCFWLTVLLCTLGCGGRPATVPVQGVVRLDGQPLKRAAVQFVPEDSGRDATATTDQDGRFVLSTFEPRDGAMPGNYKVVVTPVAPAQDPPKAMTADEAMAAAAAEAERGPAKPAHPGFPEQYTRADQTPLKQTVPATGDVVIDLKSE